MPSPKILERSLEVGPFQCNCWILACARTGHAVVIDPGDEASKILQVIDEMCTNSGSPIQVKYLLITHGHLDHIAAAKEVKEKLEARKGAPKIAIHRLDEELYLHLSMQAEMFGLHYPEPLPVDQYLEDGQVLQVGDLSVSVIHTPGHSPGGVCFHTEHTLYCGDTLFQGSIGRTDLWGGNMDTLLSSIRERIFTLDENTRVCPGHGPDTQVGAEKRSNPFLS